MRDRYYHLVLMAPHCFNSRSGSLQELQMIQKLFHEARMSEALRNSTRFIFFPLSGLWLIVATRPGEWWSTSKERDRRHRQQPVIFFLSPILFRSFKSWKISLQRNWSFFSHTDGLNRAEKTDRPLILVFFFARNRNNRTKSVLLIQIWAGNKQPTRFRSIGGAAWRGTTTNNNFFSRAGG